MGSSRLMPWETSTSFNLRLRATRTWPYLKDNASQLIICARYDLFNFECYVFPGCYSTEKYLEQMLHMRCIYDS